MKLKEVCAETGLSRKTVRLYEIKGLIQPGKERRNGRDYREYTREDVETLKVVASLRRAWFTMEEIHRMQQDPAAIREIFPQYRAWLLAQQRQLEELLGAAERIRVEQIADVAQLSRAMGAASGKLPLPEYDVNPHFRRLEALEEPPRTVDPVAQGGNRMRFNDITGGSDVIDQTHKNRMYRQFVANTSRTRDDDLAVAFGQWNEAMEMGRRPRRGARRLSGGVIGGIALLGLLFLCLLVAGLRQPSGPTRNFPFYAGRGVTTGVEAVLDGADLGMFSRAEAEAAADKLLEDFEERYRGCALQRLAVAPENGRVESELQFVGYFVSGRYLSTSLGVEAENQLYRLHWTLVQEEGTWYIMLCWCEPWTMPLDL